MAFQVVGSLLAGAVDVAPPKDVQSFTLETADTAVQPGQVMKLEDVTNYRFTPVGVSDKEALLVSIEGVEAPSGGARATFRGRFIVPGMLFKAPILNGAHGDAKPGQTVRFHTNGTGVDVAAEHATDEPVVVLRSIDGGDDREDAVICTLQCLLGGVSDGA